MRAQLRSLAGRARGIPLLTVGNKIDLGRAVSRVECEVSSSTRRTD